MKQKNNRRTIYLLLSIFLHALFLLLFAFYGFRHMEFQTIIPTPKMQQKQEELARLKPKLSDGGSQTTLFLDEPPSPKATTTPTPPQKKPSLAPTPPKPATKKAAKAPPKKVTVVKKEIKSPIPQEKTTVEKPLDLKKLALANLLKPKEENEAEEQKATTVAVNTATAPSSPEPKKKSILSLPKCILDMPNGNSAMDREGVEKFPGLEDMKFLGYEQTLQDHYLNTWKMYFSHDKDPRYHCPEPCSIYIVLNEEGLIDTITLQKTSGNPLFDERVIECYKQAAPFPPIPKHFGVKKYRPRGGTIHLPSY